jgi:hypothetical protein
MIKGFGEAYVKSLPPLSAAPVEGQRAAPGSLNELAEAIERRNAR